MTRPIFLLYPADSVFEFGKTKGLAASTTDETEAIELASTNGWTVERWVSGEPITAV